MWARGLVLGAALTGEPFSYGGRHFQVEETVFRPRPVQPRIPIWVACQVPNRVPLTRAARWDGVILAAMTADMIEKLRVKLRI